MDFLYNIPTFKKRLLRHTFYSVLFSFSLVCAQESSEKSVLYNWFDSVVGEENSKLYNGVLFVDDLPVIEGSHRFFGAQEFALGCVTYGDQSYCNQNLKYDLFADQLLTAPKGSSQSLVLQLQKSLITGFSMNGSRFVKIDDNLNQCPQNIGFVEVVMETNLSRLVKKNRKTKIKKTYNGLVFNDFELEANYFLVLGNECYPIDKERDWRAILSTDKKEIKTYYKAYASLRKTDSDAFMKMMFQSFVVKAEKNNSL